MAGHGADRDVSERIARLLELLGHDRPDYIGEDLSQLEHALQSAHLAREADAPGTEVLAALLHDVGHVCDPAGARMQHAGGALGAEHHEDIGADFLAALGFGEDVTELVRAHVDAKRYLVRTNRSYAERLSEASRRTLALQGGPMTASECAVFEASGRLEAKLRVRSWDEAAKVPNRRVPGFDTYVPLLVEHLTRPRP